MHQSKLHGHKQLRAFGCGIGQTGAQHALRRATAVRCLQRKHINPSHKNTCDVDDSMPRRQLLGLLSAATLSGMVTMPMAMPQQAQARASPAGVSAGEWTSPGLNAPEDPSLPKFFKTTSGVKVQELSSGSGDVAVKKGDTVLFDYVLRRANGYFIYGTIEGVSFQPRDTPVGPVAFRLGDGNLIPGLEEVLLGMKKGGKRRALIPPSAGYADCNSQEPQPPTFATKRQLQSHCTEPLLFELEVLRITPAAA